MAAGLHEPREAGGGASSRPGPLPRPPWVWVPPLLTFGVRIDAGQQGTPGPAIQVLKSLHLAQWASKASVEGVVQVELAGAPLSIAKDHQYSQEGELHWGEQKGGQAGRDWERL